MLQFRDKEEEFVFGIMPMNLEEEVDAIFQLISRAKINRMWDISKNLEDCIDKINESEKDEDDNSESED